MSEDLGLERVHAEILLESLRSEHLLMKKFAATGPRQDSTASHLLSDMAASLVERAVELITACVELHVVSVAEVKQIGQWIVDANDVENEIFPDLEAPTSAQWQEAVEDWIAQMKESVS